ncbi:MAG TPA: GtrA family protein [Sphingobium sp.]|uniref:GtrA family protein n=1 Tax=Sphingobium sp. TaxID=1912891 RepID=UPI002ED48978
MRTMVGQLFRYAIAGGGAAALYAVTYILFANMLLPHGYAVAAVVPAFFLSLTASFLLHSRWSFAGHGAREKGVGQPLRFTLVQMGGLGLNATFTWLVTAVLGGANWMALIPCLILTPLATFAVQRVWVFS